ncbi:MAG: hypothetical protein WD607_10235 [Candidatus Paceibacterota bacterium]
MIEIIFVFIMGILATSTLKVQAKAMPTSYFYFSRLIDGLDEDISFIGATFRTIIPLLFGVVSAIFAGIISLQNTGIEYGSAIGFLTIFLLIWPDILNPGLISPSNKKRIGKLYLLYMLLLFTFTLLGAIGGYIGDSIVVNYSNIINLIDAQTIFNTLLVMMIWAFLTYLIKYYINSFQETTD